MQYSEAVLQYSFAEDWQSSLFEQALADMGFEAFVPDEESSLLRAYIPTALLDVDLLHALVQDTDGVQLLQIAECPDQNWNATWEQEHPEFTMCVGGHELTIIPHCAFGAGYHATTAMILEQLPSFPLTGAQVLDNGCGTGVLGIAAAKLGAASVCAVDIDEKSVENTRENALLNQVQIDVRLGDTPISGQYHLILSNIHRNILIQQMPLYAQYLVKGGQVWISGFMETDCSALMTAADQAGLHCLASHAKDEWRMIQLCK